jgi:(+)-trans-carveol dehydrogenase
MGRESHVVRVPWVESDDVADAVLFLACDESRYMTGVALPIDAGLMIKR